MNAAIIAGNTPERRVDALRQFWEGNATDPLPLASFWLGLPKRGVRRRAYNAAGVLETLLLGRLGLFRPRLAPGRHAGAPDVWALYDLEPLRRSLAEFVDFDRVNDGPVRVSFEATDVVTGERVVFDSAERRIGPEHVLASCALLPMFAPVEVEGRLLGDGCLSANTPLDLVLDEPASANLTCFVVDLFAQKGSRPSGLLASATRASDLAFANQTRSILEGRKREYRMRELIHRLRERLPEDAQRDPEIASILAEARDGPQVAYLRYRTSPEEPGLFKVFDFSRATLGDRWRAGADDMTCALRAMQAPQDEPAQTGMSVREIALDDGPPATEESPGFSPPSLAPAA
ncbi:MAG: DUF3734 domain-containing protein [Acetobacteraceae bacterium]|nr:DUF3734 domain-containing protein [Acetobacteraceae bacterium]